MRTSYERGKGNTPARNHVERKPETVRKPNPVMEPESDFMGSSDFVSEEPVVHEEPSVSEEQRAVSSMIASGYAQVKDAMDSAMNGGDNFMQSDDFGSGNSAPASNGKVKGGKKQKKAKPAKQKNSGGKKSKKGLVIGLIVVFVAAVIAVLALLVSNGTIKLGTPEPTEPPTEPYEPQYEIIAEEIGELYVDAEKTAIATGFTQEDIDGFYDRLDDAEDNGEDVADLEAELDTISDYFKDVEQLAILEAAETDLAPDTFMTDVLKVKISADEYSVLGLKNSIYARADSLLAMRQEYMRIKSELLGISDLLAFDKAVYEEAIKAITHTKNLEELSILLAKVSAESDVVKAEAELETITGWEEKKAAEEALEALKVTRDEAVRAWLIYTGELVEETTEPATEETTEGSVG